MTLLHWISLRETEAGHPGEEPAKGYLGQAHQTMSGRGVQHGASPISDTSSDDRPAMPQKRTKGCGAVPQTCVQRTGRGTEARISRTRNPLQR